MMTICLICLGLKRRRSSKMKYKFFLQNGGLLLQEKLTVGGRREISSHDDMARIFSSAELQKATNNYHKNMIVGKGGFGIVYKGILEDDKSVAIKKSKLEMDPTQIEQFINEVVVLSRISHRNVVRLLGCCLETQAPLLVYEFIKNGTLYDHLHNRERKEFLHWNLRLKIAIETANVLSYLHSAASTPVIHRDIKSANILLDHNFEVKVSDFGASRLVPKEKTQLSTIVQGTFGYLDPEYMQTNQLTEKSDVYSFGVVLVELITAMKALSSARPEEERNLANFFLCKLRQGRLFDIIDETIMRDGKQKQLIDVAKLAEGCLNVKGEDRPSMREVTMELDRLRLGSRNHSWAKNSHNEGVNESDSSNGSAHADWYNDSTQYDSLRDNVELSGGR